MVESGLQYRPLAGRTDHKWVVQAPSGKVIGWCCTEEAARLLVLAADLVHAVTDLLQVAEIERAAAESGIGSGMVQVTVGSHWHRKLENALEGINKRQNLKIETHQ